MPYPMRMLGKYNDEATPAIHARGVGSQAAAGADLPTTRRDVPEPARIGAE